VIEALASGVPVVLSDIPVMREVVRGIHAGVFAPLNDPAALAEKMLWMMNNRGQFISEKLSEFAQQHFSFERIGKLFNDFYKS
jgi:glycosyltransferase involved in cell wall biosynthesis